MGRGPHTPKFSKPKITRLASDASPGEAWLWVRSCPEHHWDDTMADDLPKGWPKHVSVSARNADAILKKAGFKDGIWAPMPSKLGGDHPVDVVSDAIFEAWDFPTLPKLEVFKARELILEVAFHVMVGHPVLIQVGDGLVCPIDGHETTNLSDEDEVYGDDGELVPKGTKALVIYGGRR